MKHVFVETNWVVDYAAPAYLRLPAARDLLDRARRQEIALHLPSLCISEGKRVIRSRFQARGRADEIRGYARWATSEGKLSTAERDVVLAAMSKFESSVAEELQHLETTLEALRSETNVDVFALDERKLELAVDIGFRLKLDPFDQSILAAVLGRSDELRQSEPDAELSFCELDGDLQPWDRRRQPRPELQDLYEKRGIWVYGDFDMRFPERPTD